MSFQTNKKLLLTKSKLKKKLIHLKSSQIKHFQIKERYLKTIKKDYFQLENEKN
jgi:hypothetical protein